jgi:hypothetical protein
LVGVKLHVSVGADIVVIRVTVPANPFWPVTVMDEPPWAPALIVTSAGLALIEKSSTVTVTITE